MRSILEFKSVVSCANEMLPLDNLGQTKGKFAGSRVVRLGMVAGEMIS